MKWLDHGVMVATFVNLDLQKAFRITAREEARDLAKNYRSDIEDKYMRQLEAYKIMKMDDLFRVESVYVPIPLKDLPGKPLKRVQCEICLDWVQDSRDVCVEGKLLCRGCTYGTIL